MSDELDDKFGDASFLADFDVDQAVNNYLQTATTTTTTAATTSTTSMDTTGSKKNDFSMPNTNDENANKRRKILESSPATAAAAPTATAASVSIGKASSSSSSTNTNDNSLLKNTLQHYFGYSTFRQGQLDVIQRIVFEKQDVAVFWATGQGKSLCYQIPALLLGHSNVAVVVSPLISLMQDQVHKLNGLATVDAVSNNNNTSDDNSIATFLGSAQHDVTAERRAVRGDYKLIYVTPEKLLSGGFLDQIANFLADRLVLFAIDEAHCVSEWGFDFRPEFRNVGNALRNHPVLCRIPILALTATAVPRVQQDIVESLRLRNTPYIAKQSFDRANLKIRILKKNAGGIASAVKELLDALNGCPDASRAASKQSTIVYAPTRSQVEELAMYLQANVKNSAIKIEAYHAGLSNEERTTAHTNFLTGKTAVVVATVAFGMGIDKPDIRRIIHHGSPKTLEEYYQQIGRAGRDGLPAECVMYVSEADFDRYKSDYYLGGLTGKARQATENSMAALRTFCLDAETCRRKALLAYFDEHSPAFGERCGTCDTCLNVATYGDDAQRDFGPLGARVVLQAISNLSEQGLSNILKVITGSVVESYRYKRGINPSTLQKAIEASKSDLPKKYPQTYYRDLIPSLAQKGYLREATQSASVNGFTRTWTTYSITQKGESAWRSSSSPILLPVSEAIRQVERAEEEKRQKVLAQLEENGIQRDKLPQEEIEKGDGEVIRAYSKWYTHLENLNKAQRNDRVSQLESLLSIIENWRSETAVKQRMAPASVLAEHLLVSIAYTAATMPPGLKLDSESLVATGVRTREIGALVTKLGQWVDEVQPAPAAGLAAAAAVDIAMVLTEVKPNSKWNYALYKPAKKTGLATWESSYNRFSEGESPQTIAMSPANGRPIQVRTVVGHILDGLVQGRSVDLKRLAVFMSAPTKSEWEQLQNAEVVTGMDVAGDPNCSGRNGDKFTLTDFLRPIIGDRIADLPYNERSDADKELFGCWCDKLKWYMALRRVGYEPSFAS